MRERNWFACGDYTINYDHVIKFWITGTEDAALWCNLVNHEGSLELLRGTRSDCVDFLQNILFHEPVHIPA